MPEVTDSILNSTKKLLGLGEDYTPFDTDVTIHINSALMSLQQLGLGPANGFWITDETQTWSQFIPANSPNISSVKTYVYLKVRLVFDPPSTSFVIEALEHQLAEIEWRLQVQVDSPNTIPPSGSSGGGTTTIVYDGFWWDLTGGIDFPAEAKVGDLGYDASTGDVWRNA